MDSGTLLPCADKGPPQFTAQGFREALSSVIDNMDGILPKLELVISTRNH